MNWGGASAPLFCCVGCIVSAKLFLGRNLLPAGAKGPSDSVQLLGLFFGGVLARRSVGVFPYIHLALTADNIPCQIRLQCSFRYRDGA